MADDETFFILAGLTDHERAIKRSNRIALGTDFDKVDKALKQIYVTAQAQLAQNPQDEAPLRILVMIRALWLWWCYMATDVERLKSELDAAKKARETMGNTITELEASVTHLSQKIAALEGPS